MIQKIKTRRSSKIVASFLSILMIVTVVEPTATYALTSGPSQPEFNSFTPIGTSDMVNLSSGDFNYNIPIMDVGGYPLNLSYDSGIGMDQEASWVGLGWNLNVGQITRNVRGIPDDFNGDEMVYENHMKENKTVGITFNVNPQFFGFGDTALGVTAGLTIQHNNYTGIGFQPSYGLSYSFTEHVSVATSLSSSAATGATVSPSVSLSSKNMANNNKYNLGLTSSIGVGVGYNSRQGLTSFNMNAGMKIKSLLKEHSKKRGFSHSGGGSISFINNTFTPAKRVAYRNSSLTFAFSLGPDIWGIDGEVGITGFGITQSIKDKKNYSKAYGYNYTHLAPADAILDFNKEKEAIISKNTLSLPVTNYTYDIHQIHGQGIGGMFRPFRGQVGHVYSQLVQDESNSGSFGGEAEGGTGWHVGLDVTLSDGFARTGKWQTPVASYFSEGTSQSSSQGYEGVYYKTIGEYTVDPEEHLLETNLGGNSPIRIGIGGIPHAPGRYAQNIYYAKQSSGDPMGTPAYQQIGINSPIKREKRELRNTAIIPIHFGDALRDPFINNTNNHSFAKKHHIAGYKVIQPNGSTYVYGETVYNLEKKESTFAVGKANAGMTLDPHNGTVNYSNSASLENDRSVLNKKGIDEYYNSIGTPAYAHTYLLTGILSSDYEDLTGNGISDDDLGSYTKFNYNTTHLTYNWRIPYDDNKASYNQGLNSNPEDGKGSVVSGTKEIKYINTIETKTHVAYFRLKDRLDGKESDGGNKHMKHIDKIFLYTKPEYKELLSAHGNLDVVSVEILSRKAIKVAHFDYDYSLCGNVPNNSGDHLNVFVNGNTINLNQKKGKLTLKSLYFTYRDSHMGKYTPYKFNYDGYNPNYSLKAYDIWGNYKPNEAVSYNVFGNLLSPQEFPFVQQHDKSLQDQYASAWSLTSVDLPSGGRIELTYETDDYQYVQNKKTMRMFKIAGAAIENVADIGENDVWRENIGNYILYQNGNFQNDVKYLIVELPESSQPTDAEFREKYLGDHYYKPIFFRFLLNMSKDAGKNGSIPSSAANDFDYVEGYFKIDHSVNKPVTTFTANGKFYGAISMKFSNMEGGVNAGKDVNPISKAGWYFGQKYLPKKVYGLPLYTSTSIKHIANQLKSDFGAIDEIVRGPNGKLRNQKLIARRYVPEKSWIRLLEPNNRKLGGGVRVQKIEMHDNWDKMLSSPNEEYKQFYGQEYIYDLPDGSSSGVATYEPNMSKENPFVEPFYNKDESLVAPREVNYVEKPFGESFFPSPTVTYSRVEVKNLQRIKQVGGQTLQVKKHATGKVVTQFYTSKDFPTIADYTELDGPGNFYSNDNDVVGQMLGNILGLNIKVNTELTLSQGFSVQTNDMNGKEKSQSIYNQLGAFISGVEYKYSTTPNGTLNNKVPMIDKDGTVDDKEVGVHYDVINDFYENYTYTNMSGIQGNVVAIPIPFIPPVLIIATVIPQSSEHKNILRTATTTKVIHRTGIMTEKIAYDLGATVSTRNIAWDAQTGEVLLTETSNEYKDNYYNFNFPAYWAYDGMGLATTNIGIKGELVKSGDYYGIPGIPNLSEVFIEGDELLVRYKPHSLSSFQYDRFWVVDFNQQRDGVLLMDRYGEFISFSPSIMRFEIVRSGHRNLQSASMASITLMKNPITNGQISKSDFEMNSMVSPNPRIINASAIEYSDFWPSQCEGNIPQTRFLRDQDGNEKYEVENLCINPYVYNIKGNYKPVRSYAYLTGRNLGDGLGVRNQGFFNEFQPYYVYENNRWVKNTEAEEKWTYASEVSKYSPYGVELENRDALGRYSAAQYGYGYTLPVAVSSNSRYNEMGFDGFEDYEENAGNGRSHFGFHNADGVEITDERSHTGTKSIKISPGQNITIKKNLEVCTQFDPPADDRD